MFKTLHFTDIALKMNTYLQCGFECRVHLQRCLHNETRPLNSWNFKTSEREQGSSAPAAARRVRPAERRNTHTEGASVLSRSRARAHTSQPAASTRKRTRSRVKCTVAQVLHGLLGYRLGNLLFHNKSNRYKMHVQN